MRQARQANLQRIRVRPGDVFVIHCDMELSEHVLVRIKETMQRHLRGAPCLVLSKGMRLSAISGLPHKEAA